MTPLHTSLAEGRWQSLSLAEQLGNVGSEISRAIRWKDKDARLFDGALTRALELLDLTLDDPRWKSRLKELARARELVADAWCGGEQYGTLLEDLDRYFFHFALFARKNRSAGQK
jgi:hypothetical protein